MRLLLPFCNLGRKRAVGIVLDFFLISSRKLIFPPFPLFTKPFALCYPRFAFGFDSVRVIPRMMHRHLVVNFQIDIQNGIGELIFNSIARLFIICIMRSAILGRQILSLAFQGNTSFYHRLCILLPNRIIKRFGRNLRRRN